MQEIIEEFSTIVDYFKILEDEKIDEGFKFKAIIKFKNSTRLDARDFQILNKRNYSFHWMTENNTLIIRWDNAKHYPNMRTYSFHKHIGKTENVQESIEMTLRDVLTFIKNQSL